MQTLKPTHPTQPPLPPRPSVLSGGLLLLQSEACSDAARVPVPGQTSEPATLSPRPRGPDGSDSNNRKHSPQLSAILCASATSLPLQASSLD